MIDPLRHMNIFSPDAFGDRRVDVVGAGATGSKVVLSLAKLGVRNIHVWDFDRVESHNVANQSYGNDDIGKLKVEALRELVERQTGTVITVHAERVDGSQELGAVVFLLTDTMASRKEIWENGLKFQLRTKLMVETRMGPSAGRLYLINPCQLKQIEGWESTLYDDAVAEVSVCGSTDTVGPTAGFLAELAVWQLIHWFAVEQGGDDNLFHEILFDLGSLVFLTRRFD